MKAVIMAGGEGRRLRPLTETTPKPLARLCGRPAIGYILPLLKANDVAACVVTLGYCAEPLAAYLAAEDFGLPLDWQEETTPLGTAGGVRAAVAGRDGWQEETILVVSGDALCDLPLADAAAFHEKSGAAVTIVTTRVDDPREYGLVDADETGRVAGFVEKPSFAQATGNLANTGIYLLSPRAVQKIPANQKFDFAEDLFPLLLREGEPVYTCTLDGYWCDVGDLDAYRRAQAALLAGQVNLPVAGDLDEVGNFFTGKRPAGKYELIPPVMIGAGAVIGDGAVIGPDCVVDDGCTVAAGAQVSESILLPRCTVGEYAKIQGAVVCTGAAVKSHAQLRQGAAVGEGAVIGSRATVCPGIHVAGGARLPDGQTAAVHLGTAGGGISRFDDEGLRGEVGVELTPELAARVGCAIGSLAAGKPVGVAAGDGRAGQVLAGALMAGIRSTGTAVMDFGTIFEAMFGFAMAYNALTIGVYVDTESSTASGFKVVCDAGLPATRKLERGVEQMLARGEFTRAPRTGFGDRMDLTGIAMIYQAELRRLAPDGLDGVCARVCSENPTIERLLGDLLVRLGCEKEQEERLVLTVSPDGRKLSVKEGDIRLSSQRVVAAYGLTLFEQEQDIAVENDFPRWIDAFAAEHRRQVYRYLLCPAGQTDLPGRQLAAKQCGRDGLMLAVVLLDYLHRHNKTLAELAQEIPDVAVEQSQVLLEISPARLLQNFTGEQTGEGLLLRDERGVVLLRPRKTGEAIRVFAEAASWETAKELCGDVCERLSGLLDKETEKG